ENRAQGDGPTGEVWIADGVDERFTDEQVGDDDQRTGSQVQQDRQGHRVAIAEQPFGQPVRSCVYKSGHGRFLVQGVSGPVGGIPRMRMPLRRKRFRYCPATRPALLSRRAATSRTASATAGESLRRILPWSLATFALIFRFEFRARYGSRVRRICSSSPPLS